ncbi:carbohydrate-binding protein [Streptomyces sp. NPDC056975]|uniref:carbohydrate-binding protein n=1 Tax=unclassified Streptomyces TaxID=2593676 RepID=UPI003636AAA5
MRKTVRGRPDGKLLATSPVPNTGDWDTYQATPAVPVDALTGRDKLSLVFKSPQDNAFDVDAVQFSNP